MIKQMMKFLKISIFVLPFLICSCNQKKTQVDIVEEVYSDNTPKKVSTYEVDEQGKPTNRLKKEIHYYEGKGKKKYIEGNFNQNQRNGLWQAYFENGKVQSKWYYVNGVPHGERVVYRENGNKYFEGQYEQGVCIGVWNFYAADGTLAQSITATDMAGIPGCGCPKCEALKKSTKK